MTSGGEAAWLSNSDSHVVRRAVTGGEDPWVIKTSAMPRWQWEGHGQTDGWTGHVDNNDT